MGTIYLLGLVPEANRDISVSIKECEKDTPGSIPGALMRKEGADEFLELRCDDVVGSVYGLGSIP